MLRKQIRVSTAERLEQASRALDIGHYERYRSRWQDCRGGSRRIERVTHRRYGTRGGGVTIEARDWVEGTTKGVSLRRGEVTPSVILRFRVPSQLVAYGSAVEPLFDGAVRAAHPGSSAAALVNTKGIVELSSVRALC
jgi:hypothetical protein